MPWKSVQNLVHSRRNSSACPRRRTGPRLSPPRRAIESPRRARRVDDVSHDVEGPPFDLLVDTADVLSEYPKHEKLGARKNGHHHDDRRPPRDGAMKPILSNERPKRSSQGHPAHDDSKVGRKS